MPTPQPTRRPTPPPKPVAREKSPAIRLAAAIGVVGLLWLAVPRLDAWQRANFADRMARHAELSSGGEARLAVRRLAGSGMSSLGALVRVAGSPNLEAAEAAREAVLNLVAGWEIDLRVNGDVESYGRNVSELGTALAKSAPNYGPDAFDWGRRVAFQLIDASQRLSAKQSLALLAQCDLVTSLPRPQIAATASEDETAPAHTFMTSQRYGLPTTQPPLPSQPPHVSTEQPTDSSAADLLLVEEPTPARVAAPVTPTGEESHSQPSEATEQPPVEAPPTVVASPLPAPASPEPVVDVPSPSEARLLLRRFRKLSNRELNGRLASASGHEQLAIEQVIRERRIPTASRPTQASAGPQADADQRLFERVGKLPAAEGRRLLRNLVADPAEPTEVRLEALSLLATSGDPQLAEIAQNRVMEDADPRVAELATQILRETR